MCNISRVFIGKKTPFILQSSFFPIAVITAVGYNNVVGKVNTHHVTTLFYLARYFVIMTARCQISTGMIVGYSQCGGIVEQTFAHNDAYIYCCFGNASATDANLTNKIVPPLSNTLKNKRQPG